MCNMHVGCDYYTRDLAMCAGYRNQSVMSKPTTTKTIISTNARNIQPRPIPSKDVNQFRNLFIMWAKLQRNPGGGTLGIPKLFPKKPEDFPCESMVGATTQLLPPRTFLEKSWKTCAVESGGTRNFFQKSWQKFRR